MRDQVSRLLVHAACASLASIVLLAGIRLCPAQDVTIFRNVAVFDGAKRIARTDVMIRDSQIARVGPFASIPAAARLIDGEGKTLLPGFIDCHVHAFSVDYLKQAAIFGVTTELDMFTTASFAAEMRAEQKSGRARDRADLLSAGTLVTAPGGHGTEYGFEIPTIARPDQAEKFVADRLAEGSDYIKIVYDDGKEIGLPWPTVDRSTLGAVIRAAHSHKKLAVVHVLARDFARQAIEEGADALVHLFIDEPIDERLVSLAAERRVFVVPTLTVLESTGGVGSGASLVTDPALEPFLTPADRRALKSAFTGASGHANGRRRGIPAEAVRKLKAAGVRILAGTDAINAGTAHGASIHRELELLVAAGLTPAEALAATTSLPSSVFGLADRGTIAEGKRADLVLVEGDPCSEIKATRAIAGVWKEGNRLDREARRQAVKKQLETLAKARAVPPPKGSETGLVSDFEATSPTARFGSGWSVSTDAMIGGKSTAGMNILPEGASGSKGSLHVSGAVEGKSPSRWAGVMFSPGQTPMAPANLSAWKSLSFWAKGDGKTASVMLFFQANGFMPARQGFAPGSGWKQYRFELSKFEGCDGSGLMGIFFGGSAEPGPFSFQIDEVRLE
jgi:imidazolonepropionase-like amidohydrolase